MTDCHVASLLAMTYREPLWDLFNTSLRGFAEAVAIFKI